MATVEKTAKYVRSKNAGPFWMTIDIFCENRNQFEAFKNSANFSKENIAERYSTEAEKVKMFFVDDLNTIKISVPKEKASGYRYERDMHSGQQYYRLLDLEL